MVDWVSCVVPCYHTEPIHGDKIMRITPDGESVWQTLTAKSVEGSYSDKIMLKTHSLDGDSNPSHIYISGNPVKFFQGHNIFGHNNPHTLTLALLNYLTEQLPQLQPTPQQREWWGVGAYEFTRVDLNSMFSLGSYPAVNDWLRSAEFSSRTRHGRPAMKGGTLYWGKNSRRWSLKAYSKGEEIQKHLPTRALPEQLQDWTNDKLRLELTLRQMELKESGAHVAANWASGHTTAQGLYSQYIAKLNMVDNMRIDHDQLITQLPARLAGTYVKWRDGYDLLSLMTRRTFYRHRKELLAYGVDITNKAPPRETSNVVPLVRVVEAVPCEVPDWVADSDLYFDPEKYLTGS